MHRLFVAIRPPTAIRESLIALMDGGIPGARWQNDEQLHLTLRFVGEVDRHRAEDVAAALGTVRFARFSIALEGLGYFGKGGRRGSLWVGVRTPDLLKALHKRIDAALAGVGVARDRRAFLPHITIARFGRRAGPIDRFVERHGGFAPEPFEATHFALFESHLGNEGARYETVARYALADPPSGA